MVRLNLLFLLIVLTSGLSSTFGQELKIGDRAPSLDVEHWLSDHGGKYPHVESFKSGKIYVVEFWATWCSPCIAAMPEIKKLQTEYAGSGVQVISISDEPLAIVKKFLKQKVPGRSGTYGELTSSYCLTTDPDGSVYKDYMEAAGQNGIPTGFLVGKSGVIEWIGHPLELEEVLKKVIAGKWDRVAYAKRMEISQKAERDLNRIYGLLENQRIDLAIKSIDASIRQYKEDPEIRGQFVFMKLQAVVASKMKDENYDGAIAAIKDLTKNEKDAMLLSAAESMTMQLKIGKGGKSAISTLKAAMVKFKDQPEELNGMAWTVVELAEGGKKVEESVIKAGVEAAKMAVDKQSGDASILDTYAHLLYLNGELDKAIIVEQKAAKLEPEVPEIAEFLKRLMSEKQGKRKR